MRKTLNRWIFAFTTACLLAFPSIGYSEIVQEEPTALAMTGDLVLARPALFAMTAVGAVVYVVSLPFSALGGNHSEAADTLVVNPFKATFERCLGCTKIGKKEKVVNTTDY